jgi:hypothetical protein
MSAVPFGTFRIIRLPNFIYLGWERNVEKNLSTDYTDYARDRKNIRKVTPS